MTGGERVLNAFGHRIPTETRELLTGPCALVLWDMQVGIAKRATSFDRLLTHVRELADAARARGVPVIYSQHYSLPLEVEDPVWIRTMWRAAGRPDPTTLRAPFLPGSDAWRFVDEVAPRPGDVVLPKSRPSFFVGTPLRELLAARGLTTIVVTGVATDRGVLSTAREAIHRGVFPVVVSDAVGSFSEAAHDRALEQLREFCDVCTSADVLSAWGRDQVRGAILTRS